MGAHEQALAIATAVLMHPDHRGPRNVHRRIGNLVGVLPTL
jgi:hypothetical protein